MLIPTKASQDLPRRFLASRIAVSRRLCKTFAGVFSGFSDLTEK